MTLQLARTDPHKASTIDELPESTAPDSIDDTETVAAQQRWDSEGGGESR
ncbi:hypothetical protein ACFQZZ_26180 [Nocardia sp. GCM10030253]